MLCAAIDIGSNTTRVLVAEPTEGQLRKVMEQRAYTRIGKGSQHDGAIDADKVAEVAEVVATQVRLAEEVGAEAVRTVATAAIEADLVPCGQLHQIDEHGCLRITLFLGRGAESFP